MTSVRKRSVPATRAPRGWIWVAAATLALAPAPARSQPAAENPVGLRDVAGPETGLVYRHRPSGRLEIAREILGRERFRVAEDLPRLPGKPWGAPGVAILDAEGDGDLDLYVTNGPGVANSLFANRLVETGELRFEDVARQAGVEAREQDSSGVCFGDLDNDGDPDLLVLGAPGPNRLFENVSRGGRIAFREVTEAAGLDGGEATSTSCAMGDVDGDGLLDVAVANAYDWSSSRGLLEPFVHNQPNRLWRNRGGLRFTDASVETGFHALAGLPEGAAGVSWAIALVDVDLDGDVDVLTLDNRGSPADGGGPQHGLLHLHLNDGRGRLRDVGPEAGFGPPSAWLGVAFADFDCDGRLDLFATNAGDYPPSFHPPGVELEVGRFASRWLLGRDGGFSDPGVGELRATPSGWGVSAPDLDNDGDPDVVYHGGLYAGFFLDAGNPGAVLLNRGCSARFRLDRRALAGSRDHSRRNVQGLATGDLDRDGFPDVVTVSSFDVPEAVPLVRNPTALGSPFDESAYWVVTHRPTDEPGVLATVPLELAPGTLAVELASANGNGWVEVTTLGTAGLVPGGRASRDGIGAVVRLATPTRPHAGLRPILGGSSYASQDALAARFGLGRERTATVEVLWPGGVRNRLEGVRAGERLLFPEIPCDVARRSFEGDAYAACVERALDRLVAAGVLEPENRGRFARSAHAAPPHSAPSPETGAATP